jgi:hypothetical protein
MYHVHPVYPAETKPVIQGSHSMLHVIHWIKIHLSQLIEKIDKRVHVATHIYNSISSIHSEGMHKVFNW